MDILTVMTDGDHKVLQRPPARTLPFSIGL